MSDTHGGLQIQASIEQWKMTAPFHITDYTFSDIDTLVVTARQDGMCGRAEAQGVYYHQETAAFMLEQFGAFREAVEQGGTREQLLALMPAGGVRNAIDCALWDLEAKRTGQPVWQLAGLEPPKPLRTTFTVGAEAPATVARDARAFVGATALKLKLSNDDLNPERIRAMRSACPDTWLMVDANQGLTRESFAALLPTLLEARVQLVEQPFPVGRESWLDGLGSPIPLAADESIQDRHDLDAVAGRVDVVNIKLDKCGGLTEALALASQARALGLELMVGNMCGTSLAMAPAFVVGQLCAVVDLDGPVSLERDRAMPASYRDGCIWCPDTLWGGPAAVAAQAG